MLKAKDKDGMIISVSKPQEKAFCIDCGDIVGSVYGDINIHHWRHKKNCSRPDSWKSGGSGESEWHLLHKEQLEKVALIKGWTCEVEKTITKDGITHRTDVFLEGVCIEFQKSNISVEDIKAREKFYGDMVWIFHESRKNLMELCAKPTFYYDGGSLYNVDNKIVKHISMFDEEINAIMVEENLDIFSWDENDIRLPGVITEHMEPIYNVYDQIVNNWPSLLNNFNRKMASVAENKIYELRKVVLPNTLKHIRDAYDEKRQKIYNKINKIFTPLPEGETIYDEILDVIEIKQSELESEFEEVGLKITDDTQELNSLITRQKNRNYIYVALNEIWIEMNDNKNIYKNLYVATENRIKKSILDEEIIKLNEEMELKLQKKRVHANEIEKKIRERLVNDKIK